MGRWVHESGLSIDEAATEVERRVGAGEPPPWVSEEIPDMPPYSSPPGA